MRLCYPVHTPDADADLMGLRGDFEQNLRLLGEIGFEGVELLVRDPAALDPAEIAAALKRHSLQAAAVATSPTNKQDGLSLNHTDPAAAELCMRRCEDAIALAAHLGAPVVIGKLRGNVSDAPGCGEADLDRKLARLCDLAAQHGVELLVEPQNAKVLNNINSIGDGLALLGRLQKPNLKLLADIFHMGITEEDLCASLKKAGGAVGFVHLSDSGRKVPFAGELPFDSIMKTFADIGYPHYLSFEIAQGDDPAKTAREAYAAVRPSCGKQQ